MPTGKNAPGETVREAYDFLNSWTATQQLLSDLYTTWPIIALMCGAALGENSVLTISLLDTRTETFLILTVFSMIVIGLMNWLTSLISWLICIFVAVSSIAITAILWWTYYDIRHTDESKVKWSILEEFVRNETGVYVLAIIATIVMVFILVIIYFLRSKLSGLAALFEEASKCMYSLPGLMVPPILAFIALALFLAFWLTVVLCLATAKFPGMEPLIKLTPVNSSELQVSARTPALIRNNSLADYKSFNIVEYTEVDWLRNMLWLYLIGLIWTTEFIFACQQLALAGAVAYWYFR